MVYDKKSLQVLHPLTEKGQNEYSLMLEKQADEILFKSKHPIRYWWQRFVNLCFTGDSAWDGSRYSDQNKYKDGFAYLHE